MQRVRVFPQISQHSPRMDGGHGRVTMPGKGGGMATLWSLAVFSVVFGLPIFAVWAVVHGMTHDR